MHVLAHSSMPPSLPTKRTYPDIYRCRQARACLRRVHQGLGLILMYSLLVWCKSLEFDIGASTRLLEVKVHRVSLLYDAHEGRQNVLPVDARQPFGPVRVLRSSRRHCHENACSRLPMG